MTDATDQREPLDWLNLDALMPVETRDRIGDVVRTGETLAAALAAWATPARELIEFIEHTLPAGLGENREVMLLLGIDELDDIFSLLTLLAMHPHGDIGPKSYESVLAGYPQYAELIASSALGLGLFQ